MTDPSPAAPGGPSEGSADEGVLWDEDLEYERVSTELIIGVLAGSTLLPFVQAVASKAGEDVYNLLRDRLTRRGRKQARDEIGDAGTVTLAEWDARILLQLPETLSPTMATRLATVQLPVDRAGWLLVRWDARRAHWQVEECPAPPATTTTLD